MIKASERHSSVARSRRSEDDHDNEDCPKIHPALSNSVNHNNQLERLRTPGPQRQSKLLKSLQVHKPERTDRQQLCFTRQSIRNGAASNLGDGVKFADVSAETTNRLVQIPIADPADEARFFRITTPALPGSKTRLQSFGIIRANCWASVSTVPSDQTTYWARCIFSAMGSCAAMRCSICSADQPRAPSRAR